MINEIKIRNTASYGPETQEISGLSKVNIFYGANGSGKTTISKVIEDEARFSDCSIGWENPTKKLIYNRDFIEKNIYLSDEIKGIFTLGEDSKEIEEEIIARKNAIDQIVEQNKSQAVSLEHLKSKKKDNEEWFEDKCWERKSKFDSLFAKAFKGVRGKKVNFKQKVLTEMLNVATLKTFEELKTRAETIFKDNLEKSTPITSIDLHDFKSHETDSILQTKIIGKEDVQISEMINSLKNSDWVKQGIELYNNNNGICPFCQQQTSPDLAQQFEEYFDKTFLTQIASVEKLQSNYQYKSENILEQIENLLKTENSFFNKTIIESDCELTRKIIESAVSNISKKIAEPSRKINIDSIDETINRINKHLESINAKIIRHNALIDNIQSEEQHLTDEIWFFLTAEITSDYNTFKVTKNGITKGIKNISKIINDNLDRKKILRKEIKEFEDRIVSIIPTITAINSILLSFGFTNFKLKESEIKGNYKIVRENGEDAKLTLSEGEKTFITFLYFYHLLNGSTDGETITTDRIVVFDDPVSSLDSNILFIVSNLIRIIVNKTRENIGTIKQIFILTHNVYFHKEVSFKLGDYNQKANDSTFWIIRKQNGNSHIQSYDFNPVKTSYELLWQEVKSSHSTETITIQNTLRRIIENYFKILGSLKDEDIINQFEGEEKIICHSLLSWINEGSHLINDDIFIENSIETNEKYLDVFKNIFFNSGHIKHYEMMMGAN